MGLGGNNRVEWESRGARHLRVGIVEPPIWMPRWLCRSTNESIRNWKQRGEVQWYALVDIDGTSTLTVVGSLFVLCCKKKIVGGYSPILPIAKG